MIMILAQETKISKQTNKAIIIPWDNNGNDNDKDDNGNDKSNDNHNNYENRK